MLWQKVTTITTYCAGVDSNAIILVSDIGAINHNVITFTNVESVGIVTSQSITIGIVNDHAGNSQAITAVDADSLHWRVLDA